MLFDMTKKLRRAATTAITKTARQMKKMEAMDMDSPCWVDYSDLKGLVKQGLDSHLYQEVFAYDHFQPMYHPQK